MEDISKAYIIGAGASYGHTDGLSEEQRPPTGNRLFVDGWRSGLLRNTDFSPLFKKLVTYLGLRGALVELDPDELECDAELFLQKLHNSYKTDVQQNITRLDDANEVSTQEALSASYYYLFEVFREYTNSFSPDGSYFATLAKHFDDSSFGVVNLNYDGLLERSIDHVGRNYHYTLRNGSAGSVPLAKVHGSVNLLNDFGSGISTDGDFIERVRPVHGNKAQHEFKQISFDKLEKNSYRDLVFGPDGHHEPVIIPPMGGNKEYEKVNKYQEFWRLAASILERADELVVLGSSLATHDDRLLSLLESSIADDVEVTVVAGSQSDSVKAKLEWLLSNPSFNLEYRYFEDYAASI